MYLHFHPNTHTIENVLPSLVVQNAWAQFTNLSDSHVAVTFLVTK